MAPGPKEKGKWLSALVLVLVLLAARRLALATCDCEAVFFLPPPLVKIKL